MRSPLPCGNVRSNRRGAHPSLVMAGPLSRPSMNTLQWKDLTQSRRVTEALGLCASAPLCETFSLTVFMDGRDNGPAMTVFMDGRDNGPAMTTIMGRVGLRGRISRTAVLHVSAFSAGKPSTYFACSSIVLLINCRCARANPGCGLFTLQSRT